MGSGVGEAAASPESTSRTHRVEEVIRIDFVMTHPGSARRGKCGHTEKSKETKSSNSAAYNMMFGSTPVSEKPEGDRQFSSYGAEKFASTTF